MCSLSCTWTVLLPASVYSAQQRYIPTSVPRYHRPTIWWNHNCHQTYHAMVRAWESGDQNRYQCARRIARHTQARIFASYKKTVVKGLSQGS